MGIGLSLYRVSITGGKTEERSRFHEPGGLQRLHHAVGMGIRLRQHTHGAAYQEMKLVAAVALVYDPFASLYLLEAEAGVACQL